MEMLERGSELGVLLDSHQRAHDGRGTVILLSGEAGVGKTTLLREFSTSVADRSRVWSGGCDDLITPRALGPFREMFALDPVEVPTDRDSMIDEFLRRIGAERGPVVAMVDDAQWADDASLDIIRYLGRRAAELPLVLCVAFRDDELNQDRPLPRLVGGLTGPDIVRIELAPLSREAVRSLAVDARIEADNLFDLTGGNPFLISESLRSPHDKVPGPVRDAILARLEMLDGPARSAAELVSQTPGGVDWATASALLDEPPRALGDAEATGLLEHTHDAFRFRHELARRAVDLALTDGHRFAINLRLLEHHEATGGDSHMLLHHAARGRAWSAIARHAPTVVEESAAAGAHYDTERLALLALERPELLDGPVVPRLLMRAAFATYMLNRFGDAVELADRAVLALEPLERPDELGDALLLAAQMHTMTVEPRVARSLAERAIDVLEPLGPTPALAMAYSTMANLDCIEARSDSAIHWGRQAQEMAAELGAEDVAVHALNYVGLARIGLGDHRGFDDLEDCVGRARRVGHAEYLFRAAANLGAALIWTGRIDEARRPLEDAAETARDHDMRYTVFHTTAQRCHVDLFTGDWERVDRDLTDLLSDDDNDPAAVLVLPLSLLGRLRTRQGDPSAAALVERSWSLAVESGQAFRIANAGLARIEHVWHTGSAEDMEAVGRELLESIEPSSAPYFAGEVRRYLKRVGVEVGSFDRCPPALDASISGDWATAARQWEQMGARYHQALELIESPERETAMSGLAILDSIGAVGTATKVRQVLRSRGWSGLPRGPRPQTRAHPAGLTPRQVDVLIELTDGKTSVEIGDTLYVSSRTVDNHVAEIIRKLGAADRHDAVRIAIDQHLVEAERESRTPRGE